MLFGPDQRGNYVFLKSKKMALVSGGVASALFLSLGLGVSIANAAEAPVGAPVSSDTSTSTPAGSSDASATDTSGSAAPAASSTPATDSTKQGATPATSSPAPDQPAQTQETTSAPAEGSNVAKPADGGAPLTGAPKPDNPVTLTGAPKPDTPVTLTGGPKPVPTKSPLPEQPKKVYVCKAVGKPGVSERWQAGNNPISVASSSLDHKLWDGKTFPTWFNDAQGRSVAIAFDTGQKLTVNDCPTLAKPTCVDPSLVDWSYTLDKLAATGTVTAASPAYAKPGDKLCKDDGLAIRAAKREYLAANWPWPQGAPSFHDTLVDTIGTFTFFVPNWKNLCEQEDIHAEWTGNGGFDKLKMSATLDGPQQPKEPPFLHEKLPGKGPAPTYYQTPWKGCNTPQPVPVTGTGTFEVQTCDSQSQNLANLQATHGGIWHISDNNGHSQDLAGIGEGYKGGLPAGFPYGPTYTVSLRDGDSNDLFLVTPWSGEWTPVDAANSPSCFPTDASFVVVVGQPTCTEQGTVDVTLVNATLKEPLDKSVGHHSNTAIAKLRHLFPAERSVGTATKEFDYTIEAALGYQSDNPNAPCYKKTEQPGTTVTAEQPPQPPTQSTVPVLASTGLDILGGVALLAALTLGGLGILAWDRRRRPVVTDEQ